MYLNYLSFSMYYKSHRNEKISCGVTVWPLVQFWKLVLNHFRFLFCHIWPMFCITDQKWKAFFFLHLYFFHNSQMTIVWSCLFYEISPDAAIRKRSLWDFYTENNSVIIIHNSVYDVPSYSYMPRVLGFRFLQDFLWLYICPLWGHVVRPQENSKN